MTRSEIVGANINKYRTQLGMSQVDFASLIGRSQTMVSMYEKGTRMPSTQTLASIAKALGVPFGNLFFSEDEYAPEDEPPADDPMPTERFTAEERHLVTVYRQAIPAIRRAALQMLELNPDHGQ